MRPPSNNPFKKINEKSIETELTDLKYRLRLTPEEKTNWNAYQKWVKDGLMLVGGSRRKSKGVIIPKIEDYLGTNFSI